MYLHCGYLYLYHADTYVLLGVFSSEIRECSFEKCWGEGRKTGAKPARNSCDPPPPKGLFIKYGWGGGGFGGFRQIFREKTSGPPFTPQEKIGSPPFFQYFTLGHLTINNYKLTLNNEHRGLKCIWWLSHHCLADFVYRNLLCTRPSRV